MSISIKVGADVNEVVRGFNKINTSLDKTSNVFKATKNAGFAFNQILREAPAFAFSFQTGLIGISNNLPIFTDALKRAKEEGASTGTVLKSLGANLLSLPSIMSIGILALTQLGRGSKEAAEEVSVLSKEAEIAKKAQDEFQSSVQKAASTIVSQAKDISDLRSILVQTNTETVNLTNSTIKLGLARLIFDQKNAELQKVLSAEIEKQFILRKRISGPSEKFKPIISDPQLDNLKKYNNDLLKLGINDTRLSGDIKRIEELNDVISTSGGAINVFNNIAKQFGDSFNRLFENFLDGGRDKVDELAEYLRNLPKLIRPIPLEFTINQERVKAIFLGKEFKSFQQQVNDYIADQNKQLVSPTIQVGIQLQIDEKQNQIQKIGDQLRELQRIGEFVGESISTAFAKAFGEIANGKNAFKALGQAIQEVVTQLIKAAVKALILNFIVGLFAPGLGGGFNVGSLIGGLPRRAAGGPVSAGQPYLVGEVGREVFVPSTSGRIIPNNGLGGIQGSATPQVIFNGDFAIRGNDLRLIMTRIIKEQGYNV